MTPAAGSTGPVVRRVERFDRVPSTNDVVRAWLEAGEPEVPVAVADEQTAGRGRAGRRWSAPPGMALLASLGFRPTWLEPDRTWRLAATVSLAMADASEDVAGLPEGTIRLKWPNDLVVVVHGPGARLIGDLTAEAAAALRDGPVEARKLAGVLGESAGLGGADPWAIVGIGLNAGWPAADFPPELAGAMTSLHEASGGRPIDRPTLLAAFLDRIETRVAALRAGRFDVAGWLGRQLTTGLTVRLDEGAGPGPALRAVGVDAVSGALVVADPGTPAGERQVHAGEVVHLRLAGEV